MLSTIQKASLGYHKRIDVIDDNEVKDKKYGYIAVDDSGIQVTLDNTQINMLRYVPERKLRQGDIFKKDQHGNFMLNSFGDYIRLSTNKKDITTIAHRWLGYNNNRK